MVLQRMTIVLHSYIFTNSLGKPSPPQIRRDVLQLLLLRARVPEEAGSSWDQDEGTQQDVPLRAAPCPSHHRRCQVHLPLSEAAVPDCGGRPVDETVMTKWIIKRIFVGRH